VPDDLTVRALPQAVPDALVGARELPAPDELPVPHELPAPHELGVLMARWRRVTGIAGLAVGTAVAAGAGALVAAEKAAVGRLRLRPDPEAAEPLGQLHGRALTVLADDGTALHVEIDGPDDAPVTVIFCHGYALSQDVWHYQRRDLASAARLVFWDQRGHGRSGESATEVSIGRLGADLHAVITAASPGAGPVVLVGHSMGGMTIMALARQHPELFGAKVTGAVLISTTADGVDPTIWVPGLLRPVARRAVTPVMRGVGHGWRAGLVERARQAGGDLAFLGTRYVAFGDQAVSPAVVDFLERVIRATPITVVAEFYLALLHHDERAALGVLARVPVIVVIGEQDMLVPVSQGCKLTAAIPGSELIRVPGAGHAVILERPRLINGLIIGLLDRAARGDRSELGEDGSVAHGQTA
jgi:pimeloyl-ACP methyl ester carboxylesterase